MLISLGELLVWSILWALRQTVTLNKILFRTTHIYTDSKQVISTPVSYYQANDEGNQNTRQRVPGSQRELCLRLLRELSVTQLHLLHAGAKLNISRMENQASRGTHALISRSYKDLMYSVEILMFGPGSHRRLNGILHNVAVIPKPHTF